jgi:amino acid adenylation domain-containing protein
MSDTLRDIASLSPRRRALFAKLARGLGLARPALARAPEARTRFPLTRAELPIWLAQRLDLTSTIYHEISEIQLTGPLRIAALERALAALVERHAALRTTFTLDGDEPVQAVGAPFVPALPVKAPATVEERARELRALLDAPFDLERGPLARFALLRESEQEARLVFVLHHLITDGASSAILLDDLAALYSAFVTGEEPVLVERPLAPCDLALEEAEADPRALDAHLAYFREALAGSSRARLPADRAPLSGAPPRAGHAQGTLDPRAAEALRALARECGATPFIVLLAAFALAIAEQSGQRDLTVGAPFARRERAELERAVGCFLVTLALRLRLDEVKTFAGAIGVCREAVLGAYAHRDVPLDRLARVAGRGFELDFSLNLLPPSPPPRLAAGLAFRLLRRPIEIPKVDVTLYARAVEEGALELTLVHDARRFDDAPMRALLERTLALLRDAAREPHAPLSVSSLSGLGPPPRSRLEGASSPLAAILEAARRFPDRPAIVDGDAIWTHDELARASASVAGSLAALGVAPGDRVALIAARRPALVAAILGVWRCGASFVLLDPAHPPSRLAACLQAAAPRLVVAIAGAEVEGLVPDRALPDELSALLALGERAPSRALPAIAAGDEAYVAFTSGSTGQPKGIRGAHGPLAHFVRWEIETFSIGPDDRVSLLSGLAHDPLLRDLLTPLAAGASIVVPDAARLLDPGVLADWLAESGVTVAHLTPSMASLLGAVELEGARGLRVIVGPALPALRLALVGGEPLSPREAARLRALAPGAVIANVYGATETPQVMAYHIVNDEDEARARVPVGRGIDGVELLVLDAQEQRARPGAVGEIVIRTPHLALGYLGEDESSPRFVELAGGSAYRTGDLGRFLPGGEVDLLGRADGQIKLRGHRIELGGVQRALAAHPAILAAAVALRPDARGEPRLVAWLVPRAAPPERALLDAHARRALTEAERPSAYVFVERLPLTPNGKLDLAKLPDPALAAPESERPRTPMEATLAAIWEEVLGVTRVGLDDDFFQLGGHSLRAVQLLARLRDASAIELPLRALFEAPTVRALALVAEPARTTAAQAGSRQLARTLLPAELDAWLLDEVAPEHDGLRASFVVRLDGALDRASLERALRQLVEERPELGARIVLDGERPVRVPGGAPSLLPPLTLRSARELGMVITSERAAPFDLAGGTLLHVRPVHLREGPDWLVVTVHAIALGAWSESAFARALVSA